MATRPIYFFPYVGKLALVGLTYFIVAKYSLYLAIPPGNASPVWPAAGIALSACLVWGMRMAPAVWAGAMLANLTTSVSFSIAALIGVGNSLEALTATLLIRRLIGAPPYFARGENVFKFVTAAALSSLLAGSVGVAALTLGGYTEHAQIGQNWLTWWLGDTTAMIVVAPLILTWPKRVGRRWTKTRLAEIGLFGVLLAVASHIVFGEVLGRMAIAYATLPFVIWAAFRYGLSGVAHTVLIVAATAIWSTVQGRGPFATDELNESLLSLQMFLSTVGAVGLALAALLEQRKEAEQSLRNERDALEMRVEHRTNVLKRDIEARKRLEHTLIKREHQLAEAQHMAHLGSWDWDVAADIVSWSDELYRIFNVDRRKFGGSLDAYLEMVHPDDCEMVRSIIDNALRAHTPFSFLHRIVVPDETVKVLAVRGSVLIDADGTAVRMFGYAQDVTELKVTEELLHEAEERYRGVVELSPDGIFIINASDTYVFANPAALSLCGATAIGQVVGKLVFDFVHPTFHQALRDRTRQLQLGRRVPPIEEKFIRLDGSVIDVEATAAHFLYKGESASLVIMRDISERKKSAARLRYLAHFDSLTGLPNRALFSENLAHALSIATRLDRRLEILFIDIDRFKNINDTLGHEVGDMILKEVAQRLRGTLREMDTVARLGGDEFVVVTENILAPMQAGMLAKKILKVLTQPFVYEGQRLTVSASIGISSFPDDGLDQQTLLKNADIAMYRAKENGRNEYQYYTAEMNLHSSDRLALEYALSHALEQQELFLHYQPQIDALSGELTGMEALLRWRHPQWGMIPTLKFITLAEDTGLINQIGEWVIGEVCAQAKLWQDMGLPHLRVAVNLSARQFSQRDIVRNISHALEQATLDPACLEIEITETTIMTNPEQTISVLKQLRKMGIHISIDDFGTGYSSLGYLKRFPIDSVKVDRSFIEGIPSDADDVAITQAIIVLAHSLGCTVTAEGTETKQQFEFLRAHHCDTIQGYYFGEPVDAAQFGELLTTRSAAKLQA